MVCPFCMHKKTEVYNTRQTKKINAVWRRRRCLHCEREFTTEEQAKPETIIKVGIAGLPRALPYSRTRLLLAIFKVCDHRRNAAKTSEYLLATIEQELYRVAAKQKQTITKEDITSKVLAALKNFDTVAYVKYLSYHQPNVDDRSLRRQLKQK